MSHTSNVGIVAAVTSQKNFCRRIVDESQVLTRFCELCDSRIDNLGWLCKNCVAVMKKSELDSKNHVSNITNEDKEVLLSMNVDEKKETKGSDNLSKTVKLNEIPFTLTLTKEERLKRSKMRQEELRNKLVSADTDLSFFFFADV